MTKPTASTPGSTGAKSRGVHDAGSPDSKRGPKAGTNPDGCTPVDLPSADAAKASLHKSPPAGDAQAKPPAGDAPTRPPKAP